MSETTFEDTPLYAWLRANAWFLLVGTALVLGIVLYREKAPVWRAAKQHRSWDSYNTLTDPSRSLADLQAAFAEAKEDDRIYAWVVLDSAQRAAEAGDQAALALLKPELQALALETSILVSTAEGPKPMAAHLLSQLEAVATPIPSSWTLPEPEGGRVEVTVSIDGTSTYVVTFGLYEASTPLGCAALKAWIDTGRFDQQDARKIGATGLTLNLSKDEAVEAGAESPAVMVERPHGLFHLAGVLTLMQLPGKAGAQDQSAVQIVLQDSFYQDGFSTVVGRATEGWEAFQAAISAVSPSATIRVETARLL